MASFTSILKRIGEVALGIERVTAPIAEIALPQFAPIIARVDATFQRLQNAVATVEANNPLDGQGNLKAQAVTTDFEAGLAFTQYVLALEGKQLVYDPSALQLAINTQVAAYNAMAQVKASFRVVPIEEAK